MQQSGRASQLRNAGIGCMLLIIISQMIPFSGSYSEDESNRRISTINLVDETLNEAPPALTGASMTYDSESDRIILFGGCFAGTTLCNRETWSYDHNTNTWTNMTSAISPAARYGHQMVYDSQSDLCILFGGYPIVRGDLYEYWSDIIPYSDIWTYDLNSNSWNEMLPATLPEPCIGQGMTYDSSADLAILVTTNETWTYDVDSNFWENINIADQPSESDWPKMTYDENSGRTILYNHNVGDMMYYPSAETWVFDSTSNDWTRMYPDTSPGISMPVSVTFDSGADRMILFTTLEGWEYPERSETWSYSLETDEWSDRSPKIQPTPRKWSSMAYDSESARTILFSGSNGFPDTWAYSYEDNSWTNMAWGSDDEVFCFVAYGGTRGTIDYPGVMPVHEDIVDLCIQHDPEIVIHTGDIVNAAAQASYWHNVEIPYLWHRFNESVSNLNELGIPLYGAPGESDKTISLLETGEENLSLYQEFFDYSEVIDQPGETELYYSFDANGIHFISLNTVDEWEGSNYTCPAVQKEWLESDLATEHDFVIVFFHHTPWSIRTTYPSSRWIQDESIREAYHQIFVEHGVDLVFNGHDYLYYRTIRDDICYVVTGGGGAPLNQIRNVSGVWQTGDMAFSEHHYCVAKAANGALNVEVFLLNGTIADTFSLLIPTPPNPTLMTIISSFTVVATIAIVILVIRKREEQ